MTYDPNDFLSVTLDAMDENYVTLDGIVTALLNADNTEPTISTPATSICGDGEVLALPLTADESVTWAIIGGTDQSKFEINTVPVPPLLRWTANGTKSFASPDDANGNNTYNVTVRATDAAGNFSDLPHTTTVVDAVELDALTQTYLATAATAGGAGWTTQQQFALDALIVTLKDAGLLAGTKIKRLYLGRARDAFGALVDVVSGTVLATQSSVPVNWSATGWSPQNLTNSSLNLQVNPATDLTQNSAGVALYASTVTTDAQYDVNPNAGEFSLRVLPTELRGRMFTATSQKVDRANGPGFYAVNRKGAAETQLYGPDGLPLGSVHTQAPDAYSATSVWFGAGSGTGLSADRIASMICIFTNMTDANVKTLRDAFETYLADFAA